MQIIARLLAVCGLTAYCAAAMAQSYPPPSPAPTQSPASGVIARHQVMKNSAVFFNNVSPVVYASFPPNVWHRIDLKPWGVPADSPWAFLSGILIITHNGDVSMTADLKVGLRRIGDTETGNCDTSGRYIGQATAVAAGQGVRSTMGSFVPLVDGAFEVCWSANPLSGLYPAIPAFGGNLHVQAWGTP